MPNLKTKTLVCKQCGRDHPALTANFGFTLPDAVWAISEPERSEVARFNDDLCQWGDRYFIRSLLEIPLAQESGRFGWGTWVEVDRSVFERYMEMYDQDGRSEPTHQGVLANELPGYDGTMGLPVRIQFRESTERPRLNLLPTDQSKLGMEQREGISQARHHEIVERLTQ